MIFDTSSVVAGRTTSSGFLAGRSGTKDASYEYPKRSRSESRVFSAPTIPRIFFLMSSVIMLLASREVRIQGLFSRCACVEFVRASHLSVCNIREAICSVNGSCPALGCRQPGDRHPPVHDKGDLYA